MIIRRLILFCGFALLFYLGTPTIAKADSNGFHYEGISGTSGNPCPWIRVTAWGWNYLENTIPGHSDSPIDVWQIQADIYDKSYGPTPLYVGTLRGGGYPGAKINFIESKSFCGKIDPNSPYYNPNYKLNANNALIWVSTVPYDPSAVGKSDPYTASGWKPLAFRAPLFSPNPAVASNAKIWIDAIHYQQSYLTPTSPINDSILSDATFSNPMTITEDDWGMRDAATPGVIDYGQCYAYLGLLRWNSGPPFGFDQSSPTTCEPLGAQFGAGYTGTEQHRTFAVPIGKPGSYGDPYPLDGHYTWNIMAAQGSDQSHSRYSNADDTSPNTSSLINFPYKLMNTTTGKFWLLTNLQASPNISVNGDYPANGKSYPAGSPITVRGSVTNASLKIAASPSVATMDVTGQTQVQQNIPILNPGEDGILAGTWMLGPGTYNVLVCANTNFAVSSVVSPQRCTTSSFNVFAPTPPTLNAVPPTQCTGPANLSWSVAAGATGYQLQISTDPAFGPSTTTINTAGTTYLYSVAEGTTYYWRVRAVYGAAFSGWSSGGGVSPFTVQKCKRYQVVSTPPPVVTPGGASQTGTVAVVVDSPNSGPWALNDQVAVTVVSFGLGGCSGSSNGVSIIPSGGPPKYVGSSAFSPVITLAITAPVSATPGTYQVCFSASSTAANLAAVQAPILPMTFVVNYPSWLQISATNSAAGDVHSNSAINGSISIHPSGVGNGFFYDTAVVPHYAGGYPGVISADGAVQLQSANTSLPPYLKYLGPQTAYAAISPESLKSGFADLLSLIRSKTGFVQNTLPSGTTLDSSNTGCSAPGGLSQVVPAINNATYTFGSVGCNVLVIGDATKLANVQITGNVTTASPLVLLVHGNVTVSPTVDTINATIVLTGDFSDGALSTALTINGSVLEIGGGSLDFERSLGNNARPAEQIVYQPGQLELLQTVLGRPSYTWTEQQ